tara:strand:- start:8115 stop:8411 length:297 start_codon:yes stop_codon:yes gene_type:complete
MNNGLNTITYLINQLVDVRVACQFWIDKDEKTQDHINELEAKLKTSETESLQKDALIYDLQKTDGHATAQIYQKELVKAEKRIKELEQSVEQLEIELQ